MKNNNSGILKYSNIFILKKNYLLLLFLLNLILINKWYYANTTNIPELNYYDEQSLQLLDQSKKCPSTLFFFSEYKTYNESFKIRKINFKDKNYFVTFYARDQIFKDYFALLQNHGLIKSNYKYGKNNLILNNLYDDYAIKNDYNTYNLDKFQKVFRYYSSHYPFNKKNLYEFYIEMKNRFFQDFDYMPETYIYPAQKDLIFDKFKNYQLDVKDLWFIKPNDKWGGKGIKILHSWNKIQLKEFVITKYITNLNLIKGKKYDLRLYVLIPGLKPLRIYFYNEGCARIATEKFNISKSSIINNFVHLTNICVNKKSKKYIHPNTINDDDGNMYNILMYKRYLKSINIDYFDIREKIKDIIIKSIISVYRNLTKENERMNVSDSSFYYLLGIDILITDQFKPILLEMNANPLMTINNNLEKENKTNLFIDTLNLVGIVPYSRKSKEPLNKKFQFMREIDYNIDNACCELKRPRGIMN